MCVILENLHLLSTKCTLLRALILNKKIKADFSNDYTSMAYRLLMSESCSLDILRAKKNQNTFILPFYPKLNYVTQSL